MERMTGVKAHTIRIWEKRYNIVAPQRTDTNIRYYTDADVKRMINIANLNQLGYKISHLAKLDDQELGRLTLSLMAKPSFNDESDVNNMMQAVFTYDNVLMEKQLNNQLLKYGIEKSFKEVVSPFMDNLYFLFRAGVISYSQFYFARFIAAEKIITATDQLPQPNGKDSCVLFVLDYHEEELELIYYRYLLRKRNVKVHYFGQPLTIEDLKYVCQNVQPTLLIESLFETRDQSRIYANMQTLNEVCSEHRIWIQTKAELDNPDKIPANISHFTSVSKMIEKIDETFPYNEIGLPL